MTLISLAAVEIFGSVDGRAIYGGMGYLAQPDLVITCAHVVADALGDGSVAYNRQAPTRSLQVRRSLSKSALDMAMPTRTGQVCPECWRPKSQDDNPISDLAVLKLDRPFDREPTIVPLAPGPQFRNRRVTTYGYVLVEAKPGGSSERRGIEVHGRCGDEIAGVIQIEAEPGSQGYWIDKGLSGAPILCEETESVIGLVRQKETHRGIKAAFVIPAPIIYGICEVIRAPLRKEREARIDRITRGLGHFDYKVEEGTRALLREYLGGRSEDANGQLENVPFGGRTDELKDLDLWLRDADGPRCRLVVADAGLGKTALIAHWIERLAGRDDAPDVIYLPISRRFGTNALQEIIRGVAGRLHWFFSNEFEGVYGSDADALLRSSRRTLSERMRRSAERQFLVVLDGLDEAATGPEIWGAVLPSDPPPNLRVLATARSRTLEDPAGPWLKELGWSRIAPRPTPSLGPLSLTALSDVLVTAGMSPRHHKDWEALVRVLHEQTNQGEPLLVDMYLRELLASEREKPGFVTVESLSRLKPGLSAYLRGWIEHHLRDPSSVRIDEADIMVVLAILSVAQGPLTAGDIARIGSRLGVRADDRTIRDFLSRATNLVVQIDRNGTFALWHPRLEQHFRESLTGETTVERVRRAIRDWIRDCFARYTQQPRDPMPGYVFRYLSEYATTPGVDLTDRALIYSRSWIMAREAYDGGYAALGDDIDKVSKYLAEGVRWRWRDPDVHAGLRLLIRGAFFSMSIRAKADRMPLEFITRARTHGALTDEQALSYVRIMSKDEDKASALVELFPCLDQGAVPLALSIARGIVDRGSRAIALASALHRVDGERRSDLLTECRRVLPFDSTSKSRLASAKARALMAGFLPESERIECARFSLFDARYGDARQRLDIVRTLMPVLLNLRRSGAERCGPQLGDFDPTVEALWIALSMEEEDLCDEADQIIEGLKHWQELRKFFKGLIVQHERVGCSYVLARAASHLKLLPSDTWVDDIASKLWIESRMQNRDIASDVALLTHVAKQLDGDRRARLRDIALDRARKKKGYFDTVALFLVSRLFDGEARAAIISEAIGRNRIDLVHWRNVPFFHAAPHLGAEVANDLFPLVLDIMRQGGGLAGVVAIQPRVDPERLRDAISASFTIESDETRRDLLTLAIPRLPEDYLGEALDSARGIERPGDFASVLLALMRRGVKGLAADAFKSACEASIHMPPGRAWLLSNIAPFLDEPSKSMAFAKAMRLATMVGDEGDQVQALLTLIDDKILSDGIRSALVRSALKAVDRIDTRKLRPRRITAESLELPKLIYAVLERVPTEQVHAALNSAKRCFNEGYNRAASLARISTRCSDDDIGLILDEAFDIEDPFWRGDAVSRVLRNWPTSRMSRGLAAVLQIEETRHRVWALCVLAPRVPDQLWPQAIEIARCIGGPATEAEVLAHMLEFIPNDLLPTVEDRVRNLDPPNGTYPMAIVRARQALTAADKDRDHLCAEALRFAREIEGPVNRLTALTSLVRMRLTDRRDLDADFRQTIGQVRLLREVYISPFLAERASYFPEGARVEACRAILASGDPRDKVVEAIKQMLPLLPLQFLVEVLPTFRSRLEDYRVASHLFKCLPAGVFTQGTQEEKGRLVDIFRAHFGQEAYVELFLLLDSDSCRSIAVERFRRIEIERFEKEDAFFSFHEFFEIFDLKPYLPSDEQNRLQRLAMSYLPKIEETLQVELLCKLSVAQSRNRRVELLQRAAEVAACINAVDQRVGSTRTIIGVLSESDEPEVFSRVFRLIATMPRATGLNFLATTITKMPVAARNEAAEGFVEAYVDMIDVWP